MRVLLVDDEPLALRRLEILLSRRPWVEVVEAVRDGHAAAKAARDLNPDVVFLDIQMPQLDGFEIASILSQTVRPEIIFVTAYEAHAVKAFEAAAIDYLLKPVEMERLEAKGTGLRGPGIRERAELSLPDADAMTANAAQFPLGVDFFLTGGDRVAALPRSTRLEDAPCT